MSQSYQKSCRDCKQEITMMELNGKWGAYNLDGSFHQCTKKVEKNGNSNKSAFSKHEIGQKALSEPLTLEALDARLRKVESMFNGGLQK